MGQHRRHLILLFFTLFQILVGFGIIIPILPAFARSLWDHPMAMGLLVFAWAGAQFLFAPFWGSLSDRVGRRPILLAGLMGYCIAFGGMAFATEYWMLLIARFFGGVLSAATIPVAQAYIADITENVAERGQRMAWMGGAMNLGFICGPAIGGLLAPLGIQTTFLIVSALAFLNVAATWFMLPEPEVQRARKPRRQQNRLQLLSQALKGEMAVFSILALVSTFGGSVMFSMMGYFMIDRFDASPGLIGMVFTTEGLWATVIQTVGVGWAMRALGEENTVRFSLLMGVAGFLLMAWSPTVPVLVVAACFISGAISFLRPTIAAMASKRTKLEQGITMGMQTAFDSAGRAIGPVVGAMLYSGAPWLPFVGAGILYLGAFFWTGRVAGQAQESEPAPSIAADD